MTTSFSKPDELVDALIARVGKRLVVGLPLGIGKALHVADALYDRAAADSSIELTLFTGLTLEQPAVGDGIEGRFLAPLAERLYADWPTPKYARALRSGQLPANVRVHEFYLRPGAWLGSPFVQQSYTSINYSQVVGALLELGVNVIAQLVAADPARPEHYSLSSNPEITLDLWPRLRAARVSGRDVALVGQVNRRMPYMGGDAELERSSFDFVLDDSALDFEPFGLPNRPVGPADYATAMHVASLVRDGGTLQVGIGSLSDALAHCLILRQREPAIFDAVLNELPGGTRTARRQQLPIETGSFEHGLFASTELVSDALFALFEANIVRRPADDHDPCVIHGGFFVGSPAFYEKLRKLPTDRRALINMTRISAVNTLYGNEQRKRAQRRNARFVNETMMATLLGAAVSDGLDDGRVVSGVGGQFDFVQMGHELDDAHSILMLRARRMHGGRPQTNIKWNYGHTTVPRHHRDVFATEYGLAATRNRSDAQTIAAMLGIADRAFLPTLTAAAQDARKLAASFSAVPETNDNTPERIAEVFSDPDVQPHFPTYPLGTVFTPVEQRLIPALEWLKHKTAEPLQNLAELLGALARGGSAHDDAIERLGLDNAGTADRITRRLLRFALDRNA
ncbi:MAG: acetyl-CoA hydrolase/transferase C-terminal domain-containing protein [Pseudomonadota bacterium]